MDQFSLILFIVLFTIHIMMTTVLGLYSRYKVEYLSLAWVMGLFSLGCGLAIPYHKFLTFDAIGFLNPYMLIALVVTSFLQTMHPLGIAMPGYLQFPRMVKYAMPAILFISAFVLALILGYRPAVILSYKGILDNLWRVDTIFRIIALGLSVYYVVNILRLPRLLVKNIHIPGYLKGFATAIGLNTAYYLFVVLFFSPVLLYVYVLVFTLLNMYIFYRRLETMAIHLPMPVMEQVREAPPTEVIEMVEKEDFNKANVQRFERVEYFMQHEQEWRDNTFGRDRLCEKTGINRHLLLQCLRSQGYNNCHDYINTYRIMGLKKGIKDGTVQSAADSVAVGFGSVKTARSCFEKMEGISLDDFIKANRK